jgi:(p)ppGpp synthase/HD superfamily hydrolase
LDDGEGKELAIAALLHDSLEDYGDVISAGMLEARFGRMVREIVAGCTGTA